MRTIPIKSDEAAPPSICLGCEGKAVEISPCSYLQVQLLVGSVSLLILWHAQ